jgi:hypothetical protein
LLQTLSSKFYRTEQTALESLNEIYSDISRLAAQCSIKFRDDRSKADFLKVAVGRQTWARGAVEEYLSNPTSFMPNKLQGLHGRLTAALTARADAGEQELVQTQPDAESDLLSVFPTHYGSQYGIRPNSRGKIGPPRTPSSLIRPNVPSRLSETE